ncbi:Coiled-coil domain-containing protein 94 [Beauveria bassiana D1-5]|uniref:Splicing factor YJU2 n=1 Tax=Beauveria bassiana D1-5 TaxID=1245745 RepID=A0A0A2VYC9_BEABA|nr:Coiled-coil domain-containing protein 94 [Beauveria bassiana D1-5]
MSERKVLQKYYPPDFDPRAITRRGGSKKTGPRIQVVRLMAPFSMKCLTCGEFIYRGRKFNSRKVTDQAQRYLNIQIYQFHIKCTRCSAEITFRTDPKNNDYAMVSGAMRNMEPWRDRGAADESLEDRLDRLEREEAEAAGEEAEGRSAMEELEAKNADGRMRSTRSGSATRASTARKKRASTLRMRWGGGRGEAGAAGVAGCREGGGGACVTGGQDGGDCSGVDAAARSAGAVL